ncbi:hypothetical protein M431DRAFT_227966 [Trichoderma harzianum CBS 226.95]|uniref:Uncharacterized protein n=1 Tax=Trichoderma harzianum CBS 226.95 TaxID=983964 RepID=A0A2T4A421_TRIHA|nr:hypothetical protein M431DRAFT_227966 [Trichoderma harzianum CBS 226.95]PTB51825.1 hypothetical protein M431DRAFT_227966 [Trichoderma harzianum CBS 226.95]
MACIAYTWMPSRIPMVRCRRANYHLSFNSYLLSLQGTGYSADLVLLRPGLVALLCFFFLSFLFLVSSQQQVQGWQPQRPIWHGIEFRAPPTGRETYEYQKVVAN